MGAGSETWCMYRATEPAEKRNPIYPYILYVLMFIYAPGKIVHLPRYQAACAEAIM